MEELGSRIVGMAGRLAAATCRWLLLVADFDRREGCAGFGLPTTARWLSHCCGLAHRTAVEHVRVARALSSFPALVEEMSSGRLSYSHVRAISRLAHDGEQRLVTELIDVAENGTVGQLETVVHGLRTVEGNDGSSGSDRPEEYVRHSWTSTSQSNLTARLDPEHGALVRSAIETVARAEGLDPAQALVRLAELALAAVNDRAHPPRPLRGDERAAIVIHLDAAAIPAAPAPGAAIPARGAPESSSTPSRSAERGWPYARIDGGPGLPNAVVERLLCQGRIRTAVHDDDGNVRALGRSRRLVSERQFRALLMRDSGCAHPGCGSRYRLEAHHVRPWIRGGRTDMPNLVLLCWRHHHAHHEGEFAIIAGQRGRFDFIRTDGRRLEHHVDPGRLADPAKPIEHEHDAVAANAAHTRWTGARLDRPWAIAVLAQRRASETARAVAS